MKRPRGSRTFSANWNGTSCQRG